MSELIFHDTETTGFPLYSEPSTDVRQPHLVQLAAQIVNEKTQVVSSSIDIIIRPNGWDIDPSAVAVHGITHERAMDVGVSEKHAVEMYIDLCAARTRLAYNLPFDDRIMRIAILRHMGRHAQEIADQYKFDAGLCVMKMARNHTNLKNKSGKPKAPKLVEAVEIILGTPLEGAHSALGDTVACRELFFKCRELDNA